MQKLTNIIILLVFLSELTFSQDIKIYHEVDTIKRALLYGLKNTKGNVVIPAKYHNIEFIENDHIFLNYRTLWDSEGKEKLSLIENEIHKLENNLYCKIGNELVGFYNPINGKEVYISHKKNEDLKLTQKHSFFTGGRGIGIVSEGKKNSLINEKLENIDGPAFEDGYLLNHNYLLTILSGGGVKIYDNYLKEIYTKEYIEKYVFDLNYIYIYPNNSINTIWAYSYVTKSLKKYDKKIYNHDGYLVVEKGDQLLVLNNDTTILQLPKPITPITKVDFSYSNPCIIKLDNRVYRNNKLIGTDIDDLRTINNSLYLLYSATETFLYNGAKKICSMQGAVGFLKTGSKIVLHNSKYNDDVILNNAKVINHDGSSINNVIYSTLDFIQEDSTYIVCKDNKFGIIDFNGKILLDFKYHHLFKNTDPICTTPYTYFGKFKDDKFYHAINLYDAKPEIINVINKFIKRDDYASNQQKGSGTGRGSELDCYYDETKTRYDIYKKKAFADLSGRFHLNKDYRYTFINSEIGSIQFYMVNEYYSKPASFISKHPHYKDYVALNNEFTPNLHSLIKLYKLKITKPNDYLKYNSERDSCGIINIFGNWVVKPDLNFKYQIVNDNLISKDSILYSLDGNQLKPLYSFHSLNYPFIKLTGKSDFRMMDAQGNFTQDEITGFNKISFFPDYYFITKKDGKSHVVDKQNKFIYDVTGYEFQPKIYALNLTSFISIVDSSFLIIDKTFKNVIKCNKINSSFKCVAYWNNIEGYLLYDINEPHLTLPLEIKDLIKSKMPEIDFYDLNEHYFIARLDDNIVILHKSDKNYKYIMKNVRYHQTFKSYSDFFLFEVDDIKTNKILYYKFDFKNPKFELIQ